MTCVKHRQLCFLFALLGYAVPSVADQGLWVLTESSDDRTSPYIDSAHNVALGSIDELSRGSQFQFPLPDKVLEAVVDNVEEHDTYDEISGHFVGQSESIFYLQLYADGSVKGDFHEQNADIGYFLEDNQLFATNVDYLYCLDYGNSAQQPPSALVYIASEEPVASGPELPEEGVPGHQSLPESSNVLYIDFDGEKVNGSRSFIYNNGKSINARPFSLDADSDRFNAEELAYIETAWEGVSEDYSLFDVNVTTDRAVYDAASIHRRAQVIVSSTCAWFQNTCTVFGVGAKPQFGANEFATPPYVYEPGWVWPFTHTGGLRRTAVGISQDISHEFAHGFWLAHDGIANGQEYYFGTPGWGPIMGFTSFTDYTTWSKGEYPGANQFQDDIATIASFIGLREDEQGDGYGTHRGVIGSFDEDEYVFSASLEFDINISLTTVAEGNNNLDARLRLYGPNGDLLEDVNPVQVGPYLQKPGATIIYRPTESGQYTLSVSGGGLTSPYLYSRYGSAGQYTLLIKSDDPAVPDEPDNPAPENTLLLVPIIMLLLND